MARPVAPPGNIRLAARLIAAAMRRNIEKRLAIEPKERLFNVTTKGASNQWTKQW